jgi:hypothetical protein
MIHTIGGVIMAGQKSMNWEWEVVENWDDIPEVSNTEAAKAVIGALMGEAETLIGSTIEWAGFGYLVTGWALAYAGQTIREHGVGFKKKHYTTLDNWAKTH